MYYIYSYVTNGMYLENKLGVGRWDHNARVGDFSIKFFSKEVDAQEFIDKSKGKAFKSSAVFRKVWI